MGARSERTFSVVVVDDHEDTRDMTSELLAADGFDVRTCASVESALAEIRRVAPDAVITDLHLGGGSGLELADTVRARMSTSGIVVVAVTGTAEVGAPERARFDAFYTKPVDYDRLASSLRALIARRHESVARRGA